MTEAKPNESWTRRFRGRQWLRPAAHALILALVAWGLWSTWESAREDIRRYDLTADSLRFEWLAVAAAAYLLSQLPNIWFWRRTLWALGQKPSTVESGRSYFVGHVGKYVPGKALVVVIRAALVRSKRCTLTAAGVAVFVETLTFMAVGAFVSGLVQVARWDNMRLVMLAIILMLGAGIPMWPPLFRRIVRGILRQRAHDSVLSVDGLDFKLMLAGWLILPLSFLAMGLSLTLVLMSLKPLGLEPSEIWPHFALVTACVSLALVAGFLTPIPGGLGVREYVLTVSLKPLCGAGHALMAAFVLRAVWLITELLVSAILYLAVPGPRDPPEPADAPQS